MDRSAPRTVSSTVSTFPPFGHVIPGGTKFEVRPAHQWVYLEYVYHETSGILGLE